MTAARPSPAAERGAPYRTILFSFVCFLKVVLKYKAKESFIPFPGREGASDCPQVILCKLLRHRLFFYGVAASVRTEPRTHPMRQPPG